MEAIIEITEIKEFQYAGGTKTAWNLWTPDKTQYSTFSATVKTEIDNAIVDKKKRKIEFTEKPSSNPAYPPIKNISAMVAEDAPLPEKKAYTGGGARSTKDTESIERQVALKSAVEVGTTNKSNAAEIVEIADLFADWFDGRRK